MTKNNYEKIRNKLLKYEKVSLDEVNVNDVDEITKIRINKRKSSNERMLAFLNEVKNPYIFKVNEKLVRIRFSDTNKTADDCLTNVLNKLYK